MASGAPAADVVGEGNLRRIDRRAVRGRIDRHHRRQEGGEIGAFRRAAGFRVATLDRLAFVEGGEDLLDDVGPIVDVAEARDRKEIRRFVPAAVDVPADQAVAADRGHVIGGRRPSDPALAVGVREEGEQLLAFILGIHGVPTDGSVAERGHREAVVGRHRDAAHIAVDVFRPDDVAFGVIANELPGRAEQETLAAGHEGHGDRRVVQVHLQRHAVQGRLVAPDPVAHVEVRHLGDRMRHARIRARARLQEPRRQREMREPAAGGIECELHRATVGRDRERVPDIGVIRDRGGPLRDHPVVGADQSEIAGDRAEKNALRRACETHDAVDRRRNVGGPALAAAVPAPDRETLALLPGAGGVEKLAVRRPGHPPQCAVRNAAEIGPEKNRQVLRREHVHRRPPGRIVAFGLGIADGDLRAIGREGNRERLALFGHRLRLQEAEVLVVKPHLAVHGRGREPAGLPVEIEPDGGVAVILVLAINGEIRRAIDAQSLALFFTQARLQRRDDVIAVGREADLEDALRKIADRPDDFARRRVDNVKAPRAFLAAPRPRPAGSHQPFAVGRKIHRVGLALGAFADRQPDDAQRLELRQRPQAQRRVVRSRRKPLAVRRDGKAQDHVGMTAGLDAEDGLIRIGRDSGAARSREDESKQQPDRCRTQIAKIEAQLYPSPRPVRPVANYKDLVGPTLSVLNRHCGGEAAEIPAGPLKRPPAGTASAGALRSPSLVKDGARERVRLSLRSRRRVCPPGRPCGRYRRRAPPIRTPRNLANG